MGNITDEFNTAEKFANAVIDDSYDYEIYAGADQHRMTKMVTQHLKFLVENTIEVLTGGIENGLL